MLYDLSNKFLEWGSQDFMVRDIRLKSKARTTFP